MNGIDTMKNQPTKHWPQYLSGASASSGAFILGTILGWSSPTGKRVRDEYNLSAIQWDWVGSIMTIGASISCLPIGYMMKALGRKWAMLCLYIPYIIGWVFLASAQNFWMLMVGRFFLGLAGGAFCISAPLYSAEIAEKEIRGIIGTFLRVMMNSGILFVYLIGPFIKDVMWINITCGILTVITASIFIFMPESPVFLVMKGRIEDAQKSYKWLRGNFYDPHHEINDLKIELEHAIRDQITFKEAFKMRATKMAIFIGFGLVTFQQMSGINIVIFYSTDIFRLAQFDLSPEISTIIIGVINLSSTFIGAFLVDRLGRRILLLTSIIGMTFCLTALGGYFFILERDETQANFGWLPVTSMGLFLMFFALGYGSIGWLMIGEVYSKHVNAVLGPINGSLNWFYIWIITFTFGPIQRAIGTAWSFWIFAIGSAVGILFTYFVIPETKNKSMADIQKMLNGDYENDSNKKV